jgi:RimJ/RimL family protein N-acetyltransferase/predicted GNAT family N-acyltransferase
VTVRSISARQTYGPRHRWLRPDEPASACAYPGDTAGTTLHVGAFDGGRQVGIASIYREPPPQSDEAGAWRLRGMATAPDARHGGHGRALLRACLGHAARGRGGRVWCNARTPARGFYEREGFTAHGEVFDIDPIGPHILMDRPVRPDDARWGLPPDPAALVVETPRLRLRPWRLDDLETFARIHADPETMRHLGDGRPLDRAGAELALAALVGHWETHGFGLWAVEHRAARAVVGRVGLWYPPDWVDPECGWLLARASEGVGIATEAARAALRYGFADRRMDRIISIIHVANAASHRVAARLGMLPGRETTWRGHPVIPYGLDASRWVSAREG